MTTRMPRRTSKSVSTFLDKYIVARKGVGKGGDPCSFYRWRWPPTEKRRQPCCGWTAALCTAQLCCGLHCSLHYHAVAGLHCLVHFLLHSTGLRYTHAFSLAALFSSAKCQCEVTYQSTDFCEARPEPATLLYDHPGHNLQRVQGRAPHSSVRGTFRCFNPCSVSPKIPIIMETALPFHYELIFLLSLTNTQAEANPNNNLMMRQAGLSCGG